MSSELTLAACSRLLTQLVIFGAYMSTGVCCIIIIMGVWDIAKGVWGITTGGNAVAGPNLQQPIDLHYLNLFKMKAWAILYIESWSSKAWDWLQIPQVGLRMASKFQAINFSLFFFICFYSLVRIEFFKMEQMLRNERDLFTFARYINLEFNPEVLQALHTTRRRCLTLFAKLPPLSQSPDYVHKPQRHRLTLLNQHHN